MRPLHIACDLRTENATEIVQMLLDALAQPDGFNREDSAVDEEDSRTPLHVACSCDLECQVCQ